MKLNSKYIQLASEALLPLLGFFLWNWSLYFILLFFFIDMFVDELMMHVKSRKITVFQFNKENTKHWVRGGVLSAVTLLITVLIIHFALYFIVDGIDFWKEALAFWNYEEFGIKQGYLLVPLLLLVNYQQYKMEFLMSATYRKASLISVWRKHTIALYVALGFAGLCMGMSQFIVFPEIVYVLGIVVFSALYKLLD